MTFIITLFNKITIFLDFDSMKVLGVIDTDYMLIRYLIKNVLCRYSITVNSSGYLQVENYIERETLLHRIILNYYSQFDQKLSTTLNNKLYEVNHKNKCVWDNRLSNLEIVTSSNNKKHRDNKDYIAYITSNYLLNIQSNLKETRKYNTDIKYLQKINRDLKKELLKENGRKLNSIYHYLRFSNITKHTKQNILNASDINILSILQDTLFSFNKNNIFNIFIKNITLEDIIQYHVYISDSNNSNKYYISLKLFIQNITYLYNKLILHNIILNNIKLLNKYKNKYLDELLKNYKIYNPNPKSSKNKLIHKYNLEFIEQNTLFSLYRMLLHGNIHFSIYKNEILTNLSVRDCFINCNKHKSFIIMYYLNLLTKLTKPKLSNKWFNSLDTESKINYKQKYNNNSIHSPSFLKITEFTKETILDANKKAEKFLMLNIKKVTHFIIQENFNSTIADTIYKNPICIHNSKKSQITKEDIKNILLNFVENEIKTFGYITIDDIFDELEHINIIRRSNGENFNNIYINCKRFIRSTLKNVPEIKALLKQLNLVYKPLNKLTLENIIKYQKNNKLKNTTCNDLNIRKEIIILKKLYKEGTKNGKSIHSKRTCKNTS